MSAFSTSAQLMVRPFRGYAELALVPEGAGRPTIAGGMIRFLFVFGAFVSLTATGRLQPVELVSAMVSFSYLAVVHFIAIAVATRSVARKVKVARAFALYAEGYGPWFVFLLVIAGGVLVAPSPALLLMKVGAWLLLGALAWSGVITFACFRSGLGLSRRDAFTATALHYIVVAGILIGYYIAAGQLLPIIPR